MPVIATHVHAVATLVRFLVTLNQRLNVVCFFLIIVLDNVHIDLL